MSDNYDGPQMAQSAWPEQCEIERPTQDRGLHSEIERLREENSTFSDSLAAKADRIDRLGETVARQVAEIERLRGALEAITIVPVGEGAAGTMRKLAVQALR